MKRVKLLQIAVYVVFAALFLQYAGADCYEGLRDAYTGGVENIDKPDIVTAFIPNAVIDAHLLNAGKDGNVQLNNNYKLEDISINANIRVNIGFVKIPWWLSALNMFLALLGAFLLGWTAYCINKIIYNIYEGFVFENKQLKMIRKISVLMIIYTIVDYAYQQESFLSNKYIISSPVTLLNTSTFNFEILLCGLLVLIIGEAFKQGVQLKEEQELTI